MKVITTHVSKWRKFKDDEKYLFIDTTYKSGEQWLAPDKKTLHGYKYGDKTKSDYVLEFKAKMRKSFVDNNDAWSALISETRIVVFACYCPGDCPHPPEFCHRNILVEIFGLACRKLDEDFTYLGET